MKRCNRMIILRLIVMAIAFPTVTLAAPPAIPTTPESVDKLVYARPFTLAQGYPFDWRKERPVVTSGYLLVLKADPDLVYPRQVAEPVLYVGNQTAERVNVGYRSGHVIAIVPGEMALTEVPVWFGTPELPERVNANRIGAERALANSAGIKPLKAKRINNALAKGGDRLEVKDRAELLRHAAVLVKKYSPVEKDLAESLLPATQ